MFYQENTFPSFKRRRESLPSETADAKRFKYLSNSTEFLPIQNISSFNRNDFSSPASNPSSLFSGSDSQSDRSQDNDTNSLFYQSDSKSNHSQDNDTNSLFFQSDSESLHSQDGQNSLFSQSDSDRGSGSGKLLSTQFDDLDDTVCCDCLRQQCNSLFLSPQQSRERELM